MQVVEKVSQKGCTTYQSIADELISELQHYKRLQGEPTSAGSLPPSKRRRTNDPSAEDDGEKNVRRRVYDSLNVLKAVGAVIPLRSLTGTTRKEVLWVGLPSNLEEVRAASEMQEELKQHVREVQQAHEQVQVWDTARAHLCSRCVLLHCPFRIAGLSRAVFKLRLSIACFCMHLRNHEADF